MKDSEYPPYDQTIVEEGGTPLAVSKASLLGENPLKAWRRHVGLTQEDMAKKMGISRPAYTQMEKSRRPQSKTLERAAVVFGTTAAICQDSDTLKMTPIPTT